ncbi:MAG: DUF3109 family protein [Saprospiraceae bacterium]
MFLINDILVSDALFEEHFQCDLDKCKGACCTEGDFGAPVTHGEIREIEKILDQVIDILPQENKSKIKEEGFTKYYAEPDFIGTNLLKDGSCVFLVKNEKGIGLCALESLYLQGKTDWKKPVSCELFPIRVVKNEIKGFEALNYFEWDICNPACKLGEKNKLPVFRFLKSAIIRKYGEDCYHQMELAYENWEKDK